jgi:hypothetical protein
MIFLITDGRLRSLEKDMARSKNAVEGESEPRCLVEGERNR